MKYNILNIITAAPGFASDISDANVLLSLNKIVFYFVLAPDISGVKILFRIRFETKRAFAFTTDGPIDTWIPYFYFSLLTIDLLKE